MTTCNCTIGAIGTGVCHCTACHLTFGSVYAFDKHRPGKAFPIRCLTADALTARGWVRNAAGRWVTSAMPADVRQEVTP
jgi:hypothetical protein